MKPSLVLGFVVFRVQNSPSKSIVIRVYKTDNLGIESRAKILATLTDVKIRQYKPTPGKIERLWDSDGLFLQFNVTGKCYWRVKYSFNGKANMLSIGPYPAITLKEARERRDEIRSQVAHGIDPSGHRKAKKAAVIRDEQSGFELVAREWVEKKRKVWAESHTKTVISRLERDLIPYLGNMSMAQITPMDVLEVLRKVEARGAIETSHRELSILSQVFDYAVATGRCERSVTVGLTSALTPVVHTNFSAVLDPQRLGEILTMFDSYEGTPVVRAALRLSPVLFVRPGELRRMRWLEVNFETCEWRLIAQKTETPLIVPLANQAIEILKELKPLTGRGEWVFQSNRPGKPLSENGVNAAIRTLGIPKEELTAHGFRATARTLLDEVLGFRVATIEMQLGHRVADVHGRSYNRTQFLPERRAMMQRWADYLDELKRGINQ